MSIISDISSLFNNNNSNSNSYTILEYPQSAENEDDGITIFAVDEQDISQQNAVADKPLEQGQFTSDSKQLKPYIITITGKLYPTDLELDLFNSAQSNYQTILNYITDSIQQVYNYLNGTQLFTLSNNFSFGIYEPLSLEGFSIKQNADNLIPVLTFSFKQVQSTIASTYNTTQTSSNVSQPQNSPNING